jgi:hypothetical protein
MISNDDMVGGTSHPGEIVLLCTCSNCRSDIDDKEMNGFGIDCCYRCEENLVLIMFRFSLIFVGPVFSSRCGLEKINHSATVKYGK